MSSQMADRVIIPEVVEPEENLPRDLQAMKRFARLMDEAVQIPGTRKRIGLDAALGLIPGIGDAMGAAVSMWVVLAALRHRVPMIRIARMVLNIVIDLVVGSIPVAGDVFDLFFTENVGNVNLLIRYRNRHKPPRSVASILLVFLLISLLLLALMIGLIMLIGMGITALMRS